jgi:hypothetical protein
MKPQKIADVKVHLVNSYANAPFLERLRLFEPIPALAFRNARKPKGGYLELTDDPGLGLELDMGFIRAILLCHRNCARRFGASETVNILEELRGRIDDGTRERRALNSDQNPGCSIGWLDQPNQSFQSSGWAGQARPWSTE